jgi:hypothetical protein
MFVQQDRKVRRGTPPSPDIPVFERNPAPQCEVSSFSAPHNSRYLRRATRLRNHQVSRIVILGSRSENGNALMRYAFKAIDFGASIIFMAMCA